VKNSKSRHQARAYAEKPFRFLRTLSPEGGTSNLFIVCRDYFRLKAGIRTISLLQDVARDMNDSWVNACRSAKPPRSIRLLGDCRQAMPAHMFF